MYKWGFAIKTKHNSNAWIHWEAHRQILYFQIKKERNNNQT